MEFVLNKKEIFQWIFFKFVNGSDLMLSVNMYEVDTDSCKTIHVEDNLHFIMYTICNI